MIHDNNMYVHMDSICLYVYVHVHVCVCICVCMCVCVSVCCVRLVKTRHMVNEA